MTKVKDIPPHPLASVFPRIEPKLWDKLEEDIRDNGLIEPITLIKEDGEDFILDGVNRFGICQALGIQPEFVYYIKVTTPWPLCFQKTYIGGSLPLDKRQC